MLKVECGNVNLRNLKRFEVDEEATGIVFTAQEFNGDLGYALGKKFPNVEKME